MRARPALIALAAAPLLMITGAASAADGGRPLSTDLTGAAEVPGPGDPDAAGDAAISLNQGLGTVCFDLSWADIDGTVFAGHIHVGTSDVAGPVVVGLFSGALDGTDTASGCIAGVDPALVKNIRQNPDDYYINVHSDVYPAGAVRGQLG